MTLTPARIAEIRERVNAATKGPYECQPYDEDCGGIPIIGANLGGLIAVAGCQPTEIETRGSPRVVANATFIAHARTDLPEALDAIEEMEKEIAKRDAEINRLKGEAS